MNLFFDNGHLTDEGLQAIVDQTLTDMQNLEAAEHLSFCDECLVKYTALLTGETLVAPPQPLRQPVLRRLRKKATLVLFNKYTTVAAAAALAVALWASGVFTPPVQAAPPAQANQSQSFSLNAWLNQATANASNAISNFWSDRFDKQPTPKNDQAPATKNDTDWTAPQNTNPFVTSSPNSEAGTK
ncbi:hypothetical protein LJC61_06725 [Ruminococcaceae bacterium OttesenSCG-928-A16]|nr:hypothetical protein [Ruminococcaceae bacterium OttesenSCG-928-A16]